MKILGFKISLLVLLAITSCNSNKKVSIQKSASLHSSLASEELSHFLAKIYPDYTFAPSGKKGGKSIFLDIDSTLTGWNAYKIVTHSASDTVLKITGKDEQGLLAGVYDFLSSQGCVFLLSENILPKQKDNFLLNDTTIENHALARKRMVFNWHNFL